MKNLFFIVAILWGTISYGQIKSANLTASGLTCSMCSKAIYKALLKVPSVQKVEANIEKSSYYITFKPGATVSPESLRKAVEGAGFSIAGLTLTADVGKVQLGNSTNITLQGVTYRLIGVKGKSRLEGVQTFTVVDKNYIPAADSRKWAKTIGAGSPGNVFHVTL